MKLFKNHTVAVILTILVIAGCVFFGYVKAPEPSVSDMTANEYARENYEAYWNLTEDQADILSDDTIQTIATYNAALDYTYGSILAVITVRDLDGRAIEEAALEFSADQRRMGIEIHGYAPSDPSGL